MTTKTGKKLEGYTPGPWREFRDADSHDIIGPDGVHIATLEESTVRQRDANAALIAQAPTLLEQRDAAIEGLRKVVASLRDERPGLARRVAERVLREVNE